jgi:hypothetical protein
MAEEPKLSATATTCWHWLANCHGQTTSLLLLLTAKCSYIYIYMHATVIEFKWLHVKSDIHKLCSDSMFDYVKSDDIYVIKPAESHFYDAI